MFNKKFIKNYHCDDDSDYRLAVGPPEVYDIMGAMQFNLLTFFGLRDYHFLLDVGCGSLRGGRLFIPYLLPKHYFAIEPYRQLIQKGIEHELGKDIVKIKKPTFSNEKNLTFSVFGRKFDFILATSIFTHTSQKQMRKCFDEAKKTMKSNSIFCASFLDNGKDYNGNKWAPHFKPISYTSEFIKKTAREYKFFCKIIDWPHPYGHKWAIIVNPENKKNIPDPNYIKTGFRIEKALYLRNIKLLSAVRTENHSYKKSKSKE